MNILIIGTHQEIERFTYLFIKGVFRIGMVHHKYHCPNLLEDILMFSLIIGFVAGLAVGHYSPTLYTKIVGFFKKKVDDVTTVVSEDKDVK